MATAATRIQTRMQLRSQEFAQKLAAIRKAMGRAGPQFVRTSARRLVKSLAHEAPYLTGRLRAGFWAAAKSLQIAHVEAGHHPDLGEGAVRNNIDDKKNPRFFLANLVPYVANAGGRGTGWWFKAFNHVEKQMYEDGQKVLQGVWKKGVYKG